MDTLWKAAGAAAWGAACCDGLLPKEELEALCPGAQTVLVGAFPYYAGEAPGNLSLYCRGEDYHRVLLRRLLTLCEELRRRNPGHMFVPGVDSSPLPERRAALLAGLGFRGRHGLLILPPHGSYVFLGTVLTDLPLSALPLPVSPATEATRSSCGGCDRCVRACPTGALGEGGFDFTRCLSHISQKKGPLSAQEAAWLRRGPLVWGCDLCQRACPQNQGLPLTEISEFQENLICSLRLSDVEGLSRRQFVEKYGDRAFAWRGPAPLLRNMMG